MAKRALQPDTRDPRLAIHPSGALVIGERSSGGGGTSYTGVTSVTGGIRSGSAGGRGLPRTYAGAASNAIGRRG